MPVFGGPHPHRPRVPHRHRPHRRGLHPRAGRELLGRSTALTRVARHGHGASRRHLRQPDGPGPRAGPPHGPAGRGGRLRLVLDGRDHRPRGVLAARRRGGGGAVARPRHRRPGPPAAHADGGGDGRRHPPGPAPGPRHRARHRHLVAGRHHPLARDALRRPTAGPDPRVRHPPASVPHRREGRLRRRLLRGEGVPPRRAARRAAAQDRGRRPQPQDAAAGRRGGRRRRPQLPAGVPRAVVGGAGAQGRRRHHLRLRPRRRVRARGGHRAGPPRPVLLRRGRLLRPQLRAGRLRRRGRPRSAPATPSATGTGALAAVSDRMVDAIDVMGDAGHRPGHHAGLRRRRRRRPRAHAPAVGRRPPGVSRRSPSAPRSARPERWSCATRSSWSPAGPTASAGRCAGASWPRACGAWPSSTATPRRPTSSRWSWAPPPSGWPPTWPARPTWWRRWAPPRSASGPSTCWCPTPASAPAAASRRPTRPGSRSGTST